ncbi:MAG: hypothetical protein JO333_18180 [Verrucomicrobia bacterium]|nr:hypothetical protein [Verrucomicrobiota bacterium]
MLRYLRSQFRVGVQVAAEDSTPMKELKAGFLLLLVCAAFYVLTDPRIWGGLCQLVGRFVTGVH